MLRPLLAVLLASPLFGSADPGPPPADRAHPKDTPEFRQKHAEFLARAQGGPVGLLFLGDSITAGWSKAPDVWQRHYGPHAPANFGIGGDQTQNVIWRVEHGELDHVAPRGIILLIGTNNTASHTAPEIVAGIRRLLDLIRARQPEARVLLLAILPRGPRRNRQGEEEDWQARMAVIRAVNAELPRLADGQRVRFLDVGHVFLQPDGTIDPALMPDQLHPGPEGYRRWAEAMQPAVDALLR